MTDEFDYGIKRFFAAIEKALPFAVETSQIWSLDSQGFHLIYQSAAGRQDNREVARQACIKSQTIFAQTVCAYPFKLNAQQSGVLVFDYSKSWDEALQQKVQSLIKQHFSPLGKLLSAERLSRLSGSAKRADWLGKAISLAYELEYAQQAEPVYRKVQHALKQLMYARNLFVVKLAPAGDSLTFEYISDQYDDNTSPIQIHEGVLQGSLSAYVVKSGRVIRGSSAELEKQMGYGGAQSYGHEAFDWLGVPLALGQQVFGAIVVQSYEPQIKFNDRDPNLLAVLAEALATSFQRRQSREQLEYQVELRTKELAESVQSLEEAIETQKQLQDQLVESQKQAALGRLVTGIAHELNTPLGVCVTANSLITEQFHLSEHKFEQGSLTKTDLANLFHALKHSGALLSSNLSRATDLIERFKQVSTLPQEMAVSRFNVAQFSRSVIKFVEKTPQYENYRLQLICPEQLNMQTYGHALQLVLEQLIENSMIHGFAGRSWGDIVITVSVEGVQIVIDFEDNGKGMDDIAKEKAFDPFFTTKRSDGYVGIGLHIVSNLINQTLKGNIAFAEKPDSGVKLTICIPADVEQIPQSQ